MAQITAPSDALVLGLDIGGTSTRAVVVDIAATPGARLGQGRAAGANLTSHPVEHAVANVGQAVRAALDGIDAGRVQAAVIGSAGDRNLAEPDVAARLQRLWQETGLRCGFAVESDAAVAFASGTPEPDGTLLLAGTGALAARIGGRRLGHVADGHGWLLGDLGSGFWLGREAVRLALRALDEHREPGPLGAAVVDALVGPFHAPDPRELADEVVHRVHQRRPVALSELAPLVTQYADTDPEAAWLLSGAADHLLAAAGRVRPGAALPGAEGADGGVDRTPIVLAGSLLASPTPLAAAVRDRIAARWPGVAIRLARDGAAGAAWLAALTVPDVDECRAAALHAALFAVAAR